MYIVEALGRYRGIALAVWWLERVQMMSVWRLVARMVLLAAMYSSTKYSMLHKYIMLYHLDGAGYLVLTCK